MKKLKNRKLFLGMVLMLIFTMVSSYFLFFNSKKVEAAWWNDSWGYRKSIAITNSAGSVLTNQRVKITLDTATLITAGKMQTNCNDLRVTNIDGTLLDHWDTSCNTASTLIYVKMDSLPTSGAIFYIYYGNPSAPNAEKGLGSSTYPGTSCKMMKNQGSITASGFYYIAPGGNDTDMIQVYCEVATLTADWTLVLQNTVNSVVPPKPNWSDVVNTVNTTGTYGGSLDAFDLFLGVKHWDYIGATAMVQVGTASTNIVKRATYDSISLNASNNYALSLGTETLYLGAGSAGIKSYHAANNYQLSTYDADHDANGSSCSASYSNTAWWYGACWDGSSWGGGDVGGYQNAPFWSGSTSDYHNYGAIYLGGADTMKNVSAAAPATEEKGTGPIAYWAFDEGFGTTANDATANRKNGTLTNMSATASPTSGWQTEDNCISGKCLAFDGGDDFVNTPNFVYNQDATYSIWFKAPTSANQAGIIGNDVNSVSNYSFNVCGGLVILNGTLSATAYSNGAYQTVSTAVNQNQWYNAIFIKDITNQKIYLYLNGVLIGSQDITAASFGVVSGANRCDSNLFKIGRHSSNNVDGPNGYFRGLIDEPKIYNYARTAAQIKLDYNAGLAGVGGVATEGVAVSAGGKSPKWLSDGLVGYWKMDEASWGSVVDSSDNGNNGTAAGGATVAAGKFGNGGSFDGINDTVLIANSSSLQTVVNQITASAWIYDSSYSGDSQVIIEQWYPDSGWIIGESSIPGKIFVNFVTSNGSNNNWSSNATLSANVWHLITLVYDGAHEFLYIDGALDNSYAITGTLSTSFDNPVYIGSNAVNSFIASKMDDVRIYNRALSDREVRDLYNYAPGPVAYYNFDEGSGVALNDQSGNGLNGVLNNSPTWTTGKYGKGLKFGAANQNVTVSGFGNYMPTEEITTEFWVKSDAVSGYNQEAFWLGSDAPDRINVHFLWGTTMFWDFGVCCTPRIAIDPAITVNQWHHYAYVSSKRDNYMRIYKDGVMIGSNALPGTFTPGNYTLYLGTQSNGSTPLQGTMDEVKVYNYARTQKQIMEDMNGLAEPGSAPGNSGAGAGATVGYWKFNEGYGATANDSSPQKNNGAITGATWTNNGKFGKALSFGGSSDYVIAGNVGTSLTSMSVSLWSKAPTYNRTNSLVSKWGTSAQARFSWLLFSNFWGTDGHIDFLTSGDGTSYVRASTPANTLVANQWQHIVAVYTGSAMYIYVDGVLKGTQSSGVPSSLKDVSTPLTIGADWDTGGVGDVLSRPFAGQIDEIKVYNYALTADEVAVDYNSGSSMKLGSFSTDSSGAALSSAASLYCVPGSTEACSPPVGEWKFEDHSGTSVADTSGNGNTGTLNNIVAWTSGKNGSAIKIDTGASANNLTTATAVNLGSSGPLTLQAWVYPIAYGAEEMTVIYGATPSSYYLSVNTDGAVNCHWYNTSPAGYHSSGAGTVPLNKWTFITCAWDGANIRIYTNGQLKNTVGVTGDGIDPGMINIGAESTARQFRGKIDEVKIYNYARTQAQVALDYNDGAPIGYWKMDECQGSTIHDSSGNGYNGTWSGTGGGTQTSVGACTTAGTAWFNGATGKRNASLNFDGTDDYVGIGNLGSFPTSGTVAFWMNPAVVENYRNPFTTTLNGVNVGIRFEENSVAAFGAIIGNDTGNYTGHAYLASGLTAGAWYHVVLTWNTSLNMVTGYLDGVQKFNEAQTYWPTTMSSVAIGNGFSGDRYWQGKVDDVQIYNYALTAAQAKTLYSGGAVNFR